MENDCVGAKNSEHRTKECKSNRRCRG